jgi:hypothetical protein
LCACTSDTITTYPAAKDLAEEILSSCSYPDMFILEQETIKGEYGVDSALFDDIYASSPTEYPGIERLFIGVVSDKNDVQTIVDNLSKTLDTVKAEYIEYIPQEYEKAKSTEIIIKDRMVAMVITADYDIALEIINNNI